MKRTKTLPGCDFCELLLPTIQLTTTKGIIRSAHICRACILELLAGIEQPDYPAVVKDRDADLAVLRGTFGA